jgi:hypothetical protein
MMIDANLIAAAGKLQTPALLDPLNDAIRTSVQKSLQALDTELQACLRKIQTLMGS